MSCIIFPSALASPESTLDSSEFSQICEQSLTWKGKHSPAPTWSRRLKREVWMKHLSTRIFDHSRTQSIEDAWISSLQDSRVSRSQSAASDEESKTTGTCGLSSRKAFKNFSPARASLRTWKESFLPLALGTTRFSTMSLPIWNSWVSEQRQDASLAQRLARPTSGEGGSSSQWPTATSRDWKDGNDPSLNVPTNGLLGRAVPRDPTSRHGLLNADWVERLMGFPGTGWTDLDLWETHAYQIRFPMLTPNSGAC